VIDASYRTTIINGVPVVATPAEIDITTVDHLRAALMRATRNGHPVVVVDMTGTSFCDSAGIQSLAAACRRARSEGNELRLVLPPSGTVPRVFALTGVDRYLLCFADMEEALANPPWHAGIRPGQESRPPVKCGDERTRSSL
jgi:anti-anti-sigma factor